MNASSVRLMSFVGALAFFPLGGCSKAPPGTEAAIEDPAEKPGLRPKEKTLAELFAEGDADGDGRLSSDELPARLLLDWKLMDLNEDGYIDADEQNAYLNPRGSEVVEEEKQEETANTEGTEVVAAGNAAEGERERRPGGPGGFGQALADVDANGDGMISKEEAPERMRENFAALDANADGLVDANEREAIAKRLREREAMRRKQQGGKGGSFGDFRGFDPGNFGGMK